MIRPVIQEAEQTPKLNTHDEAPDGLRTLTALIAAMLIASPGKARLRG